MKIVSVELKVISPFVARHLRRECCYERQRRIRPMEVERLAREIRAGRLPDGTSMHIGMLDGRQNVLNGNHRLEAVIRADIPLMFDIITVEYASSKEMAVAYSKMDVGIKRTIRDSMKAANIMPEVIGDSNFHNRLAAAVKVRIGEFKRTKSLELLTILKSHELVLAASEEYLSEAEIYYTALIGAPNRNPMYRSHVMAVALETIRYQQARAFDFWQDMAADDGLRQGDPRKTLLRWLQDNPASGNVAELTSRAAALAWNAHFQGRDLKVLRPSAMGAITITGTPWRGDGRQAPQLRCVMCELATQAAAKVPGEPLRGLRIAEDGRLRAVAHTRRGKEHTGASTWPL